MANPTPIDWVVNPTATLVKTLTGQNGGASPYDYFKNQTPPTSPSTPAPGSTGNFLDTVSGYFNNAQTKINDTAQAAANPLGHVDPLALNLFLSQVFAPAMSHLTKQLMGENKQFYDIANQNLQNNLPNLPPQYRALFEQMNTQDVTGQNDLLAALNAAAYASPALDALNANINQAKNWAAKNYYEQLKNSTGSTTDLASAIAQIAGTAPKPPGT